MLKTELKPIYKGIATAVLGLTCLIASKGNADSVLLATHKDVSVFLLSCDQHVAHIEIQAKHAAVFTQAKSGAGKFLRTMKYIVPGRCKDVAQVKVKGTVEGKLWFAAATTTEDNWRVTKLSLPAES
ncbi:MAG: hypothetical protein COA42_22940 [Alteromonadaceae bacterium]|nr:MAG: hypothetical protein COA42_22940 [Alteromonadaceae bacterium]